MPMVEIGQDRSEQLDSVPIFVVKELVIKTIVC
jgi:hypothetical protein